MTQEPRELNCKGLACPQPVLETKKALEELPAEAELIVRVDNPVSKENVAIFAANAGHRVQTEENSGEFILRITKGRAGLLQERKREQPAAAEAEAKASPRDKKTASTASPQTTSQTTFLITSNLFGQGSPDLGQVLMKSLFVTLAGQDTPPEALIFINTGVYLSTEGSPVQEHLQKIAAGGTVVLSCGTCLDYYKLKEKLAAGRVSNMYEIIEQLGRAEKVITIA